MTITTITKDVALAIKCEPFDKIEKFFEEARENESYLLNHQNHFYSCPAWGKKWSNGKTCEYHKIDVKCHFCNEEPERNFAGYGDIFMVKNPIANKPKRVVLSCKICSKGKTRWSPNKRLVQLGLF